MKWLAMLMLLLPVSTQAANNLGRLFLSPAERVSLDRLREISPAPQGQVQEGGSAEEDAVPAETSPVISINGYVKRSDGKATVWVNGLPVDEAESDDIKLEKNNGSSRVMVKSPTNGQKIKLKPGQYYEPASGKIADGTVGEVEPNADSAPRMLGKRQKEPIATPPVPMQGMDASTDTE